MRESNVVFVLNLVTRFKDAYALTGSFVVCDTQLIKELSKCNKPAIYHLMRQVVNSN